MSDAPQTPKAGGTLDLSTGRPAPPPPEPPSPQMPENPDPAIRAGKTLNLSTGRPARTERKTPVAATLGAGPIIRETVDLSTKRAEPAAPAPKPPTEPHARHSTGGKPSGSPRRERSSTSGRGKAPAASSSSLADLLDPDVLAKLRGGS